MTTKTLNEKLTALVHGTADKIGVDRTDVRLEFSTFAWTCRITIRLRKGGIPHDCINQAIAESPEDAVEGALHSVAIYRQMAEEDRERLKRRRSLKG